MCARTIKCDQANEEACGIRRRLYRRGIPHVSAHTHTHNYSNIRRTMRQKTHQLACAVCVREHKRERSSEENMNTNHSDINQTTNKTKRIFAFSIVPSDTYTLTTHTHTRALALLYHCHTRAKVMKWNGRCGAIF